MGQKCRTTVRADSNEKFGFDVPSEIESINFKRRLRP